MLEPDATIAWHPSTRGIAHVGITVPDLDDATNFFQRAFGATVLADIIKAEDPDLEMRDVTGTDFAAALGVDATTSMHAVRMLLLHDGARIELFQYAKSSPRPPVICSDYGLQHIAVLVDDIARATESVIAAGGTAFPGPYPAPLGSPDALFRYCLAPWGSAVELIYDPAP
jgi:catechol 2,3-dioxygenase-like lactoylglutathione lyase family enzyme